MRLPFVRYLVPCLGFAAGSLRAADGPVTLANSHVEVGIDPAHGLILGFGRPGQSNLLWVNPHPLSSTRHAGWIDYGGDKLWWGPQIDWQAVTGRRFPPDEALDGAWTVTARGPDRVVLQSSVSPWVGIRAEREIVLVADRPAIVIRNRFIRESAGRPRLQLWTVTQVPCPRWCWLESRPATGEPAFVNLRPQLDPGISVGAEPSLGAVRGAPPALNPYLIGTRGAWLAAVYDDLILVHELRPFPDGDYAEGVSLQLFFGPRYAELETLGGLASPAVGESVTNEVVWRILPRPPGLTDTELGRWLHAELATPVARPEPGRQ